ncbi:unnamed protein product [Adineta steineri]|uniref:Uncharacterized protein n=1 Tax=Adineta steineri TaxID=433720 RepID=A0A819RJB5_9BILA|nr:unnamed protein product [Adineta steineri]
MTNASSLETFDGGPITPMYDVEETLLKKVCNLMFPTKKSWLHFCQSLFEGGSIIDHYIGEYTPTDLDVDVENAALYHDMCQFLIKHGDNNIKEKSVLLVDPSDLQETPIGNLNLVCDYVNARVLPYTDEIIRLTKQHLHEVLADNTKLSLSLLRPEPYLCTISRSAIDELTLGLNRSLLGKLWTVDSLKASSISNTGRRRG